MKAIQAPTGHTLGGMQVARHRQANVSQGLSQATRSRRKCDLCGCLEAEPLPDLFLCPSCEREEIDRVTGADE